MDNSEAEMKQPDLGKKIAELRKSQRLTQEELVEKCNISVRTIQRIEAGEVTPRDYTVKTIFAALDYDLDQLSIQPNNQSTWLEKFFLIESKGTDNLIVKQLNIAWIFGVVYFILRFFEGMAEYSRVMEEDFFSELGYTIVKAGILISLIFFQRGFIIIGAMFENHLLKLITTVLIVANVLVIGFDIFSILTDMVEIEMVITVYSVVQGAIGIIYGYALTRFSGQLGHRSKLAGGLEIVAGLLSITVFLSFFSSFVLIPAELIEIAVIYRAMDIIRREQFVQTNA